MSFWIHAYCIDSAAGITSAELHEGIAKRLRVIRSLFCPRVEEPVDAVLNRLHIENHSKETDFVEYHLRYSKEGRGHISILRSGRESLNEVVNDVLAARQESQVGWLRRRLADVTEDVSFSLKSYDVDGMGFPLCIAAAAHIVNRCGGIIQSGTYAFMVPQGNEVRIVSEFQA